MEKTTLTKNKDGYGYKYTDLSEIHRYLEAINSRYIQKIERIDGDDYIFTKRSFDNKWEEEWLQGSRVVQANLQGIKNPAQEQGSALTYARRYSLLMAYGLATDDDEAQSLTEIKEWTFEDAGNYKITFGRKHPNETISQIFEKDKNYLDWLFESDKTDLTIKTVIETFYKGKGINILTDEEKSLKMDLMGKLGDIMLKQEIDREKLLNHYQVKSDSEMTIDQLKEAIAKLEKKGK